MTKMPGEYKYKKKICAALACLGILGVAYLGIFAMTISNISNYQRSEKGINILTADISRMEFTYLSKEAEIGPTYVASLGFVEPTNIIIARQSGFAVALVKSVK